MEGQRGEGPGRPLDPRDWEATRGEQQAETRPAAPQPPQPTQPTAPTEPPEDVPENILAQTREGEDPYLWHSGRTREHGATDAVEFIDVHKSFGRNTILNGLNLGLPDGQISMILGPSGTGKSVCIKHMSACSTRTRATCWCTASRCRTWPTTSCSRCARSSASCSRTARCSAR